MLFSIYPEFLKKLFTKAFTEGLNDTNKRVRDTEWRLAFIKLRDSIVYCHCGTQNFYNEYATAPLTCWSCKKEIILPMVLKIKNDFVMLNYDTKIYEHHIEKNQDFSEPIAEVSQNPNNPNIWGIKNLTKSKWTIIDANNETKEVEPERSVTIMEGVKINFGRVDGIIESAKRNN